jgi:PKD repeat protein/subtilisin-like proprotein convertase family protein
MKLTGAFRPGIALALSLFLVSVAAGLPRALAATLPSGFIEEPVGGTWNEAVGMLFEPNGRLYIWERSGRVWIVENGVRLSQPLLDISAEVGGWRDFGLLGVALDPAFRQNGYVYLLYVVDHHHLVHAGSPSYSAASNEYYRATIGRLTRYTARSSDGFRSVDLATRRVLVGESIDKGFPILHESHGTGTLLFGTDGTLLASCGDGASYASTDVGNAAETYYSAALTEGIIKPKENIGAFRSQLLDSLNGKVLRLDPATGDGVPSNPFFDAANPRSARSRVWALGLRNPFRMTLRPGTGSHDRNAANPGVLYIGDVGWGTWEDLHVAAGPGRNFGWPVFEGLEAHSGYYNSTTKNLDAPNPLYGTGGCTQSHFLFRDLIVQDTLATPSWPNSCDPTQPIPATLPRFVHTRPPIEWRHGAVQARVGVFNGTTAAVVNLGSQGAPVSGAGFGGNCSVGGVWYSGADFPALYRNTYFHADYGGQWIRNFTFDAGDRLVNVRDFLTGGGGVAAVATHPIEGRLYYISWGSSVRKISYVPTGNQAPMAQAAADRSFGPAPLPIQFSSAGSIDPEGGALVYRWDFGDGTPSSSAAHPAHTFSSAGGAPRSFTVTLRVTDNAGQWAEASLLVSVNNSPPEVTITSPAHASRYPLDAETIYPLTAQAADAEHGDHELRYEWQTTLRHNNHAHSDPVDTQPVTQTVISPTPCDGNLYYYQIVLTVTDPVGLATRREVQLYPDCPNQKPVAWFSATPLSGPMPLAVSFDARPAFDPDSDPLVYTWDFGDGARGSGVTTTHTYGVYGSYPVTLTVADPAGLADTEAASVVVTSPGLNAEYHDNRDLTGLKFTRHDAAINFDWGGGTPDPRIGADTFSVRWTGQIEPLYSQVYTFHALTDDGFRLWINNQRVIDSWIDQAPTERSGSIALVAMTRYDIRVEYYENGGGAVAKLSWSSSSQPKEIVPNARLFPPPPPEPAVTWPAPGPITYGAALGAAELNASSAVPGTFLYHPGAGTRLRAGAGQILSCRFVPADPLAYASVTLTRTIDVLPAPLTITADSFTRTQGLPNPPLTATYAGLATGDGPESIQTPVSLATAAQMTSPPGAYPIVASGAADPDYVITHVDGVLIVEGAPGIPLANTAAILIPDSGLATSFPSMIAVGGLAGTIQTLSVTLHGFTHTYPDDVDVLLVGPGGQGLVLLSDQGGEHDVSDLTLLFVDGAAQVLPDDGLLTSGAFRPFNVGGDDAFPAPAPAGPFAPNFAAFRGLSPNGVWSLFVIDDEGNDAGQMARGWSLAFTLDSGTPPPPPPTDTDGDGIPDAWELAHGLDPSAAADALSDDDGDGFSNLDEFSSNTDPQDPSSRLHILDTEADGTVTLIRFRAMAGRTYQVERSDGAPSGPWQPVGDQVAGSGEVVRVEDQEAHGGTRCFYRVVIVPAP